MKAGRGVHEAESHEISVHKPQHRAERDEEAEFLEGAAAGHRIARGDGLFQKRIAGFLDLQSLLRFARAVVIMFFKPLGQAGIETEVIEMVFQFAD